MEARGELGPGREAAGGDLLLALLARREDLRRGGCSGVDPPRETQGPRALAARPRDPRARVEWVRGPTRPPLSAQQQVCAGPGAGCWACGPGREGPGGQSPTLSRAETQAGAAGPRPPVPSVGLWHLHSRAPAPLVAPAGPLDPPAAEPPTSWGRNLAPAPTQRLAPMSWDLSRPLRAGPMEAEAVWLVGTGRSCWGTGKGGDIRAVGSRPSLLIY